MLDEELLQLADRAATTGLTDPVETAIAERIEHGSHNNMISPVCTSALAREGAVNTVPSEDLLKRTGAYPGDLAAALGEVGFKVEFIGVP